jgi:two-component system, cell cycle response regulator
MIDRHSPSIVVTDINMPDMNGIELCRRIRQQVSPGYVYIVLLTVKDDEKDILEGFDAGADDYLSKRSSAALFTARLRTAKRVLALEYSLKDALDKKRHLAMSDTLTGVFNRRYFERHLNRAIKHASRFGGNVSMLLFDIDHFKNINDAYGHNTGDQVLKRLTQHIGHCLKRETDWCARLGGDEFAVVLDGSSVPEAHECAERVRKAIMEDSIPTAAGPVRFTVSIGIGGLSDMSSLAKANAEALVECADLHLYRSKAKGRNRISSSRRTDASSQTSLASWSEHVSRSAPLSSVR